MKARSRGARVLSLAAGIAVAGALAAGAWQGYRYLTARPVERVTLTGDTARVADSDLRALAAAVRGMTALDAMRERARRVPWVRDAAVRRVFPDGVEIRLEAYDAVARWGEEALVSSRGEIFRASFEGTLLRVRAPEAMAADVVRELPAVRASVAPIGSPVSEITVSARGGWHIVLASGLALEAGRADVPARLARFAAAWHELAAAGMQTNHADLRYANGFALRRMAAVHVPQAGVAPAARSTRPQKKK
jgi:cell division protein FtsQ